MPYIPATKIIQKTVADPGFPRGGGANSPEGGQPTYDFAKFSQKLHEIKRIWTPVGEGGVRPKFYYVDPPLQKMCIFRHSLIQKIPSCSWLF